MLSIQYSTVDKADHKLRVGGVQTRLSFFFFFLVQHAGMASQRLRTFERMDISLGGAYSLKTLTN